MRRLEFTDEVVEGWTRLSPDADHVALGIGQRLLWSGRLVEGLLDRAAVRSGFRRRGDYEVLTLIRRSEPLHLTPVQIASQLLVSQSGVTAKIDRLERDGLLERTPHPHDRRLVELVMTDAGRTAIDRALSVSVAAYADVVRELSRAQKQTLDQLLKTILATLERL